MKRVKAFTMFSLFMIMFAQTVPAAAAAPAQGEDLLCKAIENFAFASSTDGGAKVIPASKLPFGGAEKLTSLGWEKVGSGKNTYYRSSGTDPCRPNDGASAGSGSLIGGSGVTMMVYTIIVSLLLLGFAGTFFGQSRRKQQNALA